MRFQPPIFLMRDGVRPLDMWPREVVLSCGGEMSFGNPDLLEFVDVAKKIVAIKKRDRFRGLSF